MSDRGRICLNRLARALPTAVAQFQAAGFTAKGVSFLTATYFQGGVNPLITNLDRFDHVIITSPEAASEFTGHVISRWPQWPSDLTIWCVGSATAAHIPVDAGLIRLASHPGSKPLIALIRRELSINDRVILATVEGGGRQFDVLNLSLDEPLNRLELYKLESCIEEFLFDPLQFDYLLHGSKVHLAACLTWAKMMGVDLDHLIHLVTSSQAVALLRPGSRYYRIDAPSLKHVLAVIQGEPSVKV
ncbi:hypothetical protein N8005_05895 [Litorivicinus sp.]|nr:hypothetical protein [Litorivicinus sp.]MDC1208854.1 hypothetical protein [Litorivicinus sp.]MDC1239574.1 hypothetical protein [Litorivicinus sp.]